MKLGLRRWDVDFILGSSQLAEEVIRAGWLRPAISRHKLVLYDRGDVNRVWSRILSGEQPPRVRAPGRKETTI